MLSCDWLVCDAHGCDGVGSDLMDCDWSGCDEIGSDGLGYAVMI